MHIAVFGLGYVGTVTAACLARNGHTVTGVDVDEERVAFINRGEAPIAEVGLADLLEEGIANGRLSATLDAEFAVRRSDASLVCVGTPPAPEGGPDLSIVVNVCEEIGRIATKMGKDHLIVLRSTVPPGTCSRIRDAFTDKSGGGVNRLVFNPEFLREGSAIRDFYNSAYTVVGTNDPATVPQVQELFEGVDSPLIITEPEIAEMVKYVANAWHATKITFANEVGRISEALGVDGAQVMDLIGRDTRLNVSTAYMRPGFAYGGSCLPKDISALTYCGHQAGVSVPLLEAIPTSNRVHVDRVLEAILRHDPTTVCVLGLAFKAGTDDLRESPSVHVVASLLQRGIDVHVYDPVISPGLAGGNHAALERQLGVRLCSVVALTSEEALEGADLVLATHSGQEIEAIVAACTDRPVINAAQCALKHGLDWVLVQRETAVSEYSPNPGVQ